MPAISKTKSNPLKLAARHAPFESHLKVSLAADPNEECTKDLWDMRRLLPDYPRHRAPSAFTVDFTWVANPDLREHLKLYYRSRLARWKASTFRSNMTEIKHVLRLLPPEVHLGTIQRSHIEAILPRLVQRSQSYWYESLRCVRAFLNYAANAPAWTGPRPPRDLIWEDDLPSLPLIKPRPIPPNVLEHLEVLLTQAVEAMEAGKDPGILTPMEWDIVLILRRTGMRFADLAHLQTPGANGRKGCLVQDSEGYWWVAISHRLTKTGADHRIPTRQSDGVIAAIRRQHERAKSTPNHFNEDYLFRTEEGIITYTRFHQGLRNKLAPHLLHEDKPYLLTGHQFRHSIVTEMIDQGVDIYTVKEFLGHKSLQMTERYVKVYLKTLKAKYDAYRLKSQQTSASEMMMAQAQVHQVASEADGGWMEGRVGKLYLSPLPDGIGNCAHLPMHDGCPDSPHCPTCPKLRASTRHLPVWESKATNLLITVEALRATLLMRAHVRNMSKNWSTRKK